MATCTMHRVCSDNTCGKKLAAKLHYDSATNELLIVWSEDKGFDLSTGNRLRFARFDLATLTPNSEVNVVGNGTSDQYFTPQFVIAPDGTYVVTFNNGNLAKIAGVESTDGGVNWGSITSFGNTAVSRPKGIVSDGSFVYAIASQPTSQIGDVYSYKRTGANTWAAGVKILAHSNTVEPGLWEVNAAPQGNDSTEMFSTTEGLCVGWRTVAGETSGRRRLTCLTTADGWATTSQVDIETFTASGDDHGVWTVKTSTNRVYLMYPNMDSAEKIKIAYTDDKGATWTNLGTPPIVTSTMTDLGLSTLDSEYDMFLTLDERENVLFGFSTKNVTPSYHVTFRGGSTAASYVLAAQCSYTDQWADNSTGHAIVVGNTLYRILTLNVDEGEAQTSAELYILVVEGAPIPEEPVEPSTPPVAPSGIDDNNMMLRINLADGGGWSTHLHGPSCFLSWDEGDAETGREVAILLTGNPSMDPAIADPDLIHGLTRIETREEEGYGRRVYVDASTDQQVVRNDPYRVIARSKQYVIDGDHHKNVARGIVVNYVRHGNDPLPLQVWVDGRLNRVIQLPTTHGLPNDKQFYALPTTANVGSVVQFVIDVTDNDPWIMQSWGIVYYKKGRRG